MITPGSDSPVRASERVHLRRLTSLRFFAAAAVFFYHVGKTTDWLPAEDIFRYGFTGVGFFFILSGFVLAWVSNAGMSTKDFYVRRFARVYPSHVVLVAVALVVPVLAFPVTPWGAIANLTLVQAWFMDWAIVFSLNAVTWSLSCEAFFYLCSPFLIRWLWKSRRQTLVLVCFGWLAVTTVLSLHSGLSGNVTDIWAYTSPLLRSGEFVLGVALALLMKRGWRPRFNYSWSVFTLAMVAGLTVSVPLQLPQSVVNVLFAPFFALVIVAAAATDLRRKPGLITLPVMIYAGEVSFAFYLVHELLIFNVWFLTTGMSSGKFTGLILCAGVFFASWVAAVLLHHYVELRAQKIVLRRWRLSASHRDSSGMKAQGQENTKGVG